MNEERTSEIAKPIQIYCGLFRARNGNVDIGVVSVVVDGNGGLHVYGFGD